MVKHEEGLAREIIKAVNNGELREPLTRVKVKNFCIKKKFNYSKHTINVILSNSEIDVTHSDNYKKCFKRVTKGEYIILPSYRDLYFEEEIQNSINDTSESRIKRLSEAENTKPQVCISTTARFKRNPDVVAEVRFRANGKCQKCKKDAPFISKSDNTPYLEVHHIVSLSQGGEDTVDNCIAVCPNCHRELHHGK